jgi:hypothetical protein
MPRSRGTGRVALRGGERVQVMALRKRVNLEARTPAAMTTQKEMRVFAKVEIR